MARELWRAAESLWAPLQKKNEDQDENFKNALTVLQFEREMKDQLGRREHERLMREAQAARDAASAERDRENIEFRENEGVAASLHRAAQIGLERERFEDQKKLNEARIEEIRSRMNLGKLANPEEYRLLASQILARRGYTGDTSRLDDETNRTIVEREFEQRMPAPATPPRDPVRESVEIGLGRIPIETYNEQMRAWLQGIPASEREAAISAGSYTPQGILWNGEPIPMPRPPTAQDVMGQIRPGSNADQFEDTHPDDESWDPLGF